jgi:hypothetical protein
MVYFRRSSDAMRLRKKATKAAFSYQQLIAYSAAA